MKTAVIIPSRISSVRLPRKPLADICGEPLIARVYRNAMNLRKADEILVAADSQEVADAAAAAGARSVLTPCDLESGSDRVFFAAAKYFPSAEIIVNIQGDEPFLNTAVVDKLIEEALSGVEGDVFSAYYPIDFSKAAGESVVKVVLDSDGYALYFSRSLIPHGAKEYLKHLGVYVWRRSSLERFHSMKPSLLEKSERLEQLRALENGMRIKMTASPADSPGIDTYEDLQEARIIADAN